MEILKTASMTETGVLRIPMLLMKFLNIALSGRLVCSENVQKHGM
jgi:hypothetical protein